VIQKKFQFESINEFEAWVLKYSIAQDVAAYREGESIPFEHAQSRLASEDMQ
jgi:hypothetical protein